MKVMAIWTTSPVSGPSPSVVLSGSSLMPVTTVFPTEKRGFTRLGVKASVPRLPSRVASSISTSAGEFTRVGTCAVENFGGPEVRPTSECVGKTWYTSTSTFPMLASGVPEGTINPVIVA